MGEAMTWTDAAWIVVAFNLALALIGFSVTVFICKHSNKKTIDLSNGKIGK